MLHWNGREKSHYACSPLFLWLGSLQLGSCKFGLIAAEIRKSLMMSGARSKINKMNKIINFIERYNPIKLVGEPRCLGCGIPVRTTICETCLEELEPVPSGGCHRCCYPTGGKTPFPDPIFGCPWCERLSCLPKKFICAYIYRNTGAEIFRKIKFSGYWRGNKILFEKALRRLKPHLDHDPDAAVVVIPESFISRIKRPAHPADGFAYQVAEKIQCKKEDFLKIGSVGREQVGLDYEFRKQNMKHRFTWASKKRVPEKIPKRVYLVDDVLTTGATMEAATKVLKQNGISEVIWITMFRTL